MRASIIYSDSIKALNGTVDASKLFYGNLSTLLVDKYGFETNNYDTYVVKKTSNSK